MVLSDVCIALLVLPRTVAARRRHIETSLASSLLLSVGRHYTSLGEESESSAAIE